MSSHRFFLTCPKGLESLLLDEVLQLGARSAKETVAGVYAEGPLALGYRLCLWSRLANKVLLPIATVPATDADVMYKAAKAIDWREHLALDVTFAVDFSGGSKTIKHTHFGALRVKDAIVDHFSEACGERPSVDSKRPMLRINARLARNQLTLSIDLAGESLHRRGYRQDGAAAPLKENLAAAILLRANWPAIYAKGGALLDPMCGSGTLLVEAALMAADIAPGLGRMRYGFDHWLGHQSAIWSELVDEAEQRSRDGLAELKLEIRGYDASPKSIKAAQENIQRAGLEQWVRVSVKELAQFAPPTHTEITEGLVITNPPYGERLGDQHALVHLYGHLAERMRTHFGGWQLGVFSGNPDLSAGMRLKADKRYKLFNGAIACELQLYTLHVKKPDANRLNAPASTDVNTDKPTVSPIAPIKIALSEGAVMFANRIKKNKKQLKSWLKREQISCYRLYDADMPEYAVAVDCYGDKWQVTEYQAPKSVDPVKAAERFADVQAALPEALGVSESQIVYKKRQRQKGMAQYEKLDTTSHFFEVEESPIKALVNLHDYLDTGLFLDHRPARRMLAQYVKGKRFLNLFCYTAVATLHAAAGGAKNSTSVDMSATYINWAKRNLALNGLSETKHEMVQANCLAWLDEAVAQVELGKLTPYDVIFLDPPSFSNSKRMEESFDVQSDHVHLIHQAMSLLSESGLLIFSNNLRSFKLDDDIKGSYQVEDVSAKTIDMDFKRNTRIHQCWHIKHVTRDRS